MDSRDVAHKYRLSKWTEIVRECRSSGKTVAAWCTAHDVNIKSYYYWLRRVRVAACEALPALKSGENTIVPVNNPALSARNSLANRESSADITLRFGAVTLELHNNASAMLIENTLRALQNVR